MVNKKGYSVVLLYTHPQNQTLKANSTDIGLHIQKWCGGNQLRLAIGLKKWSAMMIESVVCQSNWFIRYIHSWILDSVFKVVFYRADGGIYGNPNRISTLRSKPIRTPFSQLALNFPILSIAFYQPVRNMQSLSPSTSGQTQSSFRCSKRS